MKPITVSVKISSELLDRIRQLAQANGRTYRGQLEFLLRKALSNKPA